MFCFLASHFYTALHRGQRGAQSLESFFMNVARKALLASCVADRARTPSKKNSVKLCAPLRPSVSKETQERSQQTAARYIVTVFVVFVPS
jgi:hypothetical protein